MVRADTVTHAHDPGHDHQIAALLRLAGRRRAPDAARLERARAAARLEWQRTQRGRGRRRLMMAAAVVATAGAVGSAAWFWPGRSSPGPAAAVVATAQRVIGTIRVTDAAGREPEPGIETQPKQVRAGNRVEVADRSRAAFELADGTSVRLAGGTVVGFEGSGRLALLRGTMYVDAHPERRAGAIFVDTPFGRVRHVGTQFELRLQPSSLTVRVREGEVAVDGRGASQTSRAGESLRISHDRPPERGRIDTAGPEWAWVTSIAQPFTLEGATASAFVQWVSREQGWQWAYADEKTKRLAERAVLHGSMEGLSPEEALAAVLPASGLTSRRDGDRLIVASM